MANNQANVSKLNRRSFLTGAAMTGAAAMPSASAYAAGAPPEGEKRPNFLVIMVDQHNPTYFGYAGHPVVQTPNIDQLAASSVNLSRAYVTNPVCMPSRASFFTGLTTRGHRVRMNGIPLSQDIPTMTESLRRSGYRTHCVGKLHFRTSGTPTGGDPSATSPEDFPEARAHWLAGRIENLPSPYYGFESVDYANGHGPGTWGHYLHWLEREHPAEFNIFQRKTALEPPSPAFHHYNRTSFKWALPQEVHPTTWVADRTVDFLKKVSTAATDQPFFLFCSIADPHSPFAPPKELAYKYKEFDVVTPLRREGELDLMPPHYRAQSKTDLITSGSKGQSMGATDPYRAECAAHYYALIDLVDQNVGRVLNTLRETGLEQDTVVVFAADHGEALGDHWMWGKGPYHYDGVVRVPLLIRWPGHSEAGYKHEGVVSYVDVAPTILEIAGLPIPVGPTSPRARSAERSPSLAGTELGAASDRNRPIHRYDCADRRGRGLSRFSHEDSRYPAIPPDCLLRPRLRRTV
ncbi:MAG: sulfatase-like hydrolase/transferase [Bryobacterales bacterium]|nr:sulfatase-like hydrolase/transferase [Bryobacterales bacterium]